MRCQPLPVAEKTGRKQAAKSSAFGTTVMGALWGGGLFLRILVGPPTALFGVTNNHPVIQQSSRGHAV